MMMMTVQKGCNAKAVERSARRREKSREAARCRRQLESDVYNELCEIIPIPTKILSQMDRSTVMRLLNGFIKLRKVVDSSSCKTLGIKSDGSSNIPTDEEYVNALNGFIMVLSHDCDILYASSNVKQHIGMSNLDLIGQNLFEFTHDGDHSDITKCMKMTAKRETENKLLFMRMKSTLMSSGRNVNLKSAKYKVLKCDGTICHDPDESRSFMVTYCEPIPHPENIEMVLDCKTFLSQHSLDMKFTFCDGNRIGELLGYSEEDMMENSFYDFCHTCDLNSLESSMQKLFRLGQICTGQYRMLAKCGGYVWLTSQATIINNARNHQPAYIVCVHHIISEIIESTSILSLKQMEYVQEEIEAFIKCEVQMQEDISPIVSGETEEDCIYNSTDLIFRDVVMGSETDINFPEDIFIDDTNLSPRPTEVLAQNAPSIGDQIDFSQLNFSEIFGIESVEDICRNCSFSTDAKWNAPSGMQDETLKSDSSDASTKQDYLFENVAIKEQLATQQFLMAAQDQGLNHVPDRPAKPKLSDYQVISVPKAQYQHQLQNPSMKRHLEAPTKCANMCGENGSFQSVPVKRQKLFPNAVTASCDHYFVSSPNIPDTAKLLLQRNTDQTKFLGSSFSNPKDEWGGCKPCIGSDLSWPAEPTVGKMSLLPIVSLHDCEVNAPFPDNFLLS